MATLLLTIIMFFLCVQIEERKTPDSDSFPQTINSLQGAFMQLPFANFQDYSIPFPRTCGAQFNSAGNIYNNCTCTKRHLTVLVLVRLMSYLLKMSFTIISSRSSIIIIIIVIIIVVIIIVIIIILLLLLFCYYYY